MKTYVYGYDIQSKYDVEPHQVRSRDRYAVVSHDPLTDEEVANKILRGICTASACRNPKPLEERIEKARQMFKITNIQLVREYGKED